MQTITRERQIDGPMLFLGIGFACSLLGATFLESLTITLVLFAAIVAWVTYQTRRSYDYSLRDQITALVSELKSLQPTKTHAVIEEPSVPAFVPSEHEAEKTVREILKEVRIDPVTGKTAPAFQSGKYAHWVTLTESLSAQEVMPVTQASDSDLALRMKAFSDTIMRSQRANMNARLKLDLVRAFTRARNRKLQLRRQHDEEADA